MKNFTFSKEELKTIIDALNTREEFLKNCNLETYVSKEEFIRISTLRQSFRKERDEKK